MPVYGGDSGFFLLLGMPRKASLPLVHSETQSGPLSSSPSPFTSLCGFVLYTRTVQYVPQLPIYYVVVAGLGGYFGLLCQQKVRGRTVREEEKRQESDQSRERGNRGPGKTPIANNTRQVVSLSLSVPLGHHSDSLFFCPGPKSHTGSAEQLHFFASLPAISRAKKM